MVEVAETDRGFKLFQQTVCNLLECSEGVADDNVYDKELIQYVGAKMAAVRESDEWTSVNTSNTTKYNTTYKTECGGSRWCYSCKYESGYFVCVIF